MLTKRFDLIFANFDELMDTVRYEIFSFQSDIFFGYIEFQLISSS